MWLKAENLNTSPSLPPSPSSQSELQQQASELTAEESLDDELEKLADELVSDDTVLLTDSRTDDDLMLEMEEFI